MSVYVVGDIHGCYKSLTNLLKLIEFNVDKDTIVSVGDIADKGPTIKECFDFFINYGMLAIKGNHEEGLVNAYRRKTKNINKWKKDTLRQLGDDVEKYISYMENLPLYLHHSNDNVFGYIVHGGVEPNLKIEQQYDNNLLRLRKFPHVVYEEGKPDVGMPWQNSYKGHLGLILHGHEVCSNPYWHKNPYVVSLDGGCVYGRTRGFQGVLRCVRLEDMKIFEVKTHKSEVKHFLSL